MPLFRRAPCVARDVLFPRPMALRSPFAADALRFTLLAALGVPGLAACQTDADPNAGTNTRAAHGEGADAGADNGQPTSPRPNGEGPIDSEPSCTNPVPLFSDQLGGYVSCDEGYAHRPESKACTSILPRSRQLEPTSTADGGTLDECLTDEDCPGPHGYCERYSPSYFGG